MKKSMKRFLAVLSAVMCMLQTTAVHAEEQSFSMAELSQAEQENISSSQENPDEALDSKNGEILEMPAFAPMYRLYNPNSGEHFYTQNTFERDDLSACGWRDEGIGWYSPLNEGVPVFRLYNPDGGDHHYTMDANERDALIRSGWKDEGTGWKSLEADHPYALPVLRQYNPNQYSANHNYSASTREDGQLWEWGWTQEGIGWYGVLPFVQETDSEGNVKLLDPQTGSPLSGWVSILGNQYYLDPANVDAMRTEPGPVPGKDNGIIDVRYFDSKGRQVFGFYENADGRLSYIDRSTGLMIRSRQLILRSRTDGSWKGLYDCDASGDCVEGQVCRTDGNHPKSILRFSHPGSEKTMPLYDAMKKVGQTSRAVSLMNIGLQYEGWPYLWGGRLPSQKGFDCSGLVCYCMSQGLGKNVWATAQLLWDQSVRPVSREEAKPGDLVFWRGDLNGRKNYIFHVGIYLGGGWSYQAGDPIGFYKVNEHAGTVCYGRLK